MIFRFFQEKKALKIDHFLHFFSVSPKADVIFHQWPIRFIGDICHFVHEFLTGLSILARDKHEKKVTNPFYRRHMPLFSWIFDWFFDFSPW